MTKLIKTFIAVARGYRPVVVVKLTVSVVFVSLAAMLIARLPLAAGLWSSILFAGLWIYLVETVIATCWPGDNKSRALSKLVPRAIDRSSLPHSPLSDIIWGTSGRVIAHLAWRCPTLVLATLVGTAWCGEHVVVRIVVFVPTCVGMIAQRSLVRTTPPDDVTFIRGSRFGTPASANTRSKYLRTMAGLEAADDTADNP